MDFCLSRFHSVTSAFCDFCALAGAKPWEQFSKSPMVDPVPAGPDWLALRIFRTSQRKENGSIQPRLKTRPVGARLAVRSFYDDIGIKSSFNVLTGNNLDPIPSFENSESFIADVLLPELMWNLYASEILDVETT